MDQMTITVEQRLAIEQSADGFDLWFSQPDGDDDGNAKWYLDYSGRGMYGDSCLGVVLDGGDRTFALFVLALTEAVDVNFAYDLLSKTTTDSMGYSTIYYFPGVTMETGGE